MLRWADKLELALQHFEEERNIALQDGGLRAMSQDDAEDVDELPAWWWRYVPTEPAPENFMSFSEYEATMLAWQARI